VKYVQTLFAVAVMFLTASCSSLIVKTVHVYPEPTVVGAVADAPTAQPSSTQEELTAPKVEPVPSAIPIVAVLNSNEVRCMALAMYHEARGESHRGQAAVGYVILNRVDHGGYGKGICGVVYKRSNKGCQFAWVCDRHSDIPRDKNAYAVAERLARAVLTGEVANPVGKARYFDGYVHSKKRKPGTIQIGNHRFYASYASR